MVQYRRLHVLGGVYFFTANLRDMSMNYLTEHIDLLTEAFRRTRAQHPFKTIAMVGLPNHLHVMWELPENDDNYSLRWMKIKSYFAKELRRRMIIPKSNFRRESRLWQRRFWEHALRNETDYENHVNYIHYNPVKHRLVSRVKHWPYSTVHRYLQLGILPENWGDLGKYDEKKAMRRS